ncbi:MAG: serine protease [Desulfuromonadaceae bacterium]|nr:serine protease [Desulfuromonadaceae bacterium]
MAAKKKKKTTVSLVLGSGGARGYAHIGIIQWLIENGFDIRSIAGCSMGALIGGIYAAGELDAYAHWARALERKDVLMLLDFTFGGRGFFKGEKVIGALKKLIGERNIEDLPISFTAVATDIQAEKEVWLSKGPLFDAIRASIAIPTFFTPFNYQGKILFDGGLLNPIPIAPTLRDITDLTIAVNLSAKGEMPVLEKEENLEPPNAWERYRGGIVGFMEELQQKWLPRGDEEEEKGEEIGLLDILSQSMDTMQNAIARFKLATYSPEVIIPIPKCACTFLDFHRADEMIRLGYHQAGVTMESFLAESGGKPKK